MSSIIVYCTTTIASTATTITVQLHFYCNAPSMQLHVCCCNAVAFSCCNAAALQKGSASALQMYVYAPSMQLHVYSSNAAACFCCNAAALSVAMQLHCRCTFLAMQLHCKKAVLLHCRCMYAPSMQLHVCSFNAAACFCCNAAALFVALQLHCRCTSFAMQLHCKKTLHLHRVAMQCNLQCRCTFLPLPMTNRRKKKTIFQPR